MNCQSFMDLDITPYKSIPILLTEKLEECAYPPVTVSHPQDRDGGNRCETTSR